MNIRNYFIQIILMPVIIGSLLFSSFPPVLALASQPDKSSADFAAAQLASLTPEEKVGQLFLITFNGADSSPASPIYDLINNYHLGGVILDRYNDNFLHPEHILQDCWSLTRNLQLVEFESSLSVSDDSINPVGRNSAYIPLFIGISQEGNQSEYTELLTGLSPIPSQMSLGATWDPALAELVGSQVGRELSSLGINLLFGPSLDVVSNPSPGQSDLGVRSFGGDPYWVGKFGQAYIRGLHNGSLNTLAVVAKYFPGLGSSDRLPEEEIATVRKSLEQLKQIDLAPFFAITGNAQSTDSAADALLNSHIRYQGLQGNIRSTTRPISLDPQAFELLMSLEPLGSWRDSGGLIISDNLGSQALQQLYDPSGNSFDISRVAVDAFIAGNDILFLGNYGNDNKAIPNHEIVSTLKFFAQKYSEDQDFANRVDSSVLRILELKNSIYPSFNIDTVLTSENTLSAIGNSDISETVARQSATLINPDISELDAILQSPPSSSDRLVILSDTDSAIVCSECPELNMLETTTLEDSILRLYGPFSGGQLVRANINSYSFKDLTTLLDFPAETEHMVNDLYNANWIIVAALDISENRPYSQAFSRLLAERQDLLRDKKIIVFAFSAPYYLDATNISKISAFFALYNKLPASLEVSARILFKEFPSFHGNLPVSVPGINYDLISATSPDPNTIFPVFVGEFSGAETSSSELSITPAAPVYRVEDLIPLRTGIILDHNGNPVPDGTPVTFIITSQGTSTSLPQVTTINGSAFANFLVRNGADITVQASSSQARSTIIDINILGDSAEGITSTSDNGESATMESTPDINQTELTNNQSQTDTATIQKSPWRHWGLSLIVILIVSLGAYQVGAASGQVRWGIRWSLSGVIAGLLVYNYLILDLPGVSFFFPDGVSIFSLGIFVLFGSLSGWLIAFLYQRFTKS